VKGGCVEYKCSLCGQVVLSDLKKYFDHTEDHIIDIIKKDHPNWVAEDGMCLKCQEHYKRQLKGESSQ